MIQVNAANILTIALCGALGYALVAGFPKLKAAFARTAGATAAAAS